MRLLLVILGKKEVKILQESQKLHTNKRRVKKVSKLRVL